MTSCDMQVCCLNCWLASLRFCPAKEHDVCHVDTRQMADQWKQEVEELEQRIEVTSGDVRVYFKGKLDQLLRWQKDRHD